MYEPDIWQILFLIGWISSVPLDVLLLLISGFSISSLATEFPVWDNSNVEVKEGDNLSLSCKVSGLGNIDVVRIVHKTSKQTATVTDNANVKLPFRGLPQYKVHYRLNGNVGTVHLHFRGKLFVDILTGREKIDPRMKVPFGHLIDL